jgi:ATP phosphoribosyltransferase
MEANGLVVIEHIMTSTAHIIVNEKSLTCDKTKNEIYSVVERLGKNESF